MKGMAYTDASGDASKLKEVIQKPYWALEQKLDGTRVLFDLRTMTAYQRSGTPLKHTAATQHLGPIIEQLQWAAGINVVLDGELLIGTGEFWVFDSVHTEKPSEPWTDRLGHRKKLFRGIPDGPVARVRSAFSSADKQKLWEDSHSGEGVMAKRVDGLYIPGQRVDHVLKFKHIHTVDAVVIKPPPPEGTCSMSVGVYDADGQLRPIANVTMIGKPSVVEGDVVELNYLYWTGGALYQPRMMRVRDDKDPEDCSTDQLKPYSRTVI